MSDRILIVEDDKMIAELEREYLNANGYDVDVCNDGLSGYGAALQNDYSLIILDVMLPGLDGFELCKKLRAAKDTPVLFVTAKQEPDYVIEGFSLGADDYITKPFNFRELAARVAARIERYNVISSKKKNMVDELDFGCLKLNKNSRKVYVDDNEVVMTNKEFDLLWYLASNPDIVFSRGDLFYEIWGYDSIGETSTVTVHINRIRDKINKNSAGIQFVETIWGTGYRFNS
ncbi:MAG: response regulator transcription factor [Clostridia bacterium]|nr:response regulator transcription factor [Clostridia bacterium]